MFVIVRGLITCFMADGFHVAFPTLAVFAGEPYKDFDVAQRRLDAYALDSRIRSAINSDDLVESWSVGLCKERRAELRRHGGDLQAAVAFLYPHLSAQPGGDPEVAHVQFAYGRFGPYITTAAVGITRHAKQRHETRAIDDSEVDHPDGPAVQGADEAMPQAGSALAEASVAHPFPPPPPTVATAADVPPT